ncbi:aldose 1-epimerase family protein [Agriterribacter sp.]|uniref:aldose 1-epimerase family protein n=1 Tax=Agriterribacter sp. TaxID=2821509 RepID=UPI002BEE941F|nr:aldose 1-epimerase family protein [Agriterribacter sp.]HRO45784.1 aldose 1-epimerase family protein [Agriterribacter sp.]HRQ16761.1 aldose 1-epimerase family protein [Agriterribacter sp.]
MARHTWTDKISTHTPLGGIETAVADNGAQRGARIAWINTGTGLRCKVVIDRAMDIADAFYNQHSLAWLSHSGISAPQPFSNRGADWLTTFGGGLVTTCGLTHVGGPETDEYGERGLHGAISNIPAVIESVIQPDPVAGTMEMSITGIMKQSQALGTRLELRRTISGRIGEAFIHIHDEVSNRGNTAAPHMLLYHCNLGWPLADEGARLIWNGPWQARDAAPKIFTAQNDFRKCSAPLEEHNGGGEEAAFIDIAADHNDECACGIYNEQIGIAVSIRFSKKQLPWLTNWQHWGKGEYVTGLEPGTHPPIGQAQARAQGTLIELAPGETRTYDLRFEVLHQEARITNFLNTYNNS